MRNKWMIGGLAAGVAMALILALLSFRNGGVQNQGQTDAGRQFDLSTVQTQGKTMGTPTAPVLIEVYSDYQCSHCAAAAKGVEKELAQKYVVDGRARLQYRDFPFLGMESYWAAIAAGCAAAQNRFWEYHDKLFAEQKGIDQGRFSNANLKQWAQELKLDMTAFNACFAAEESAASVREDYHSGEAKGVNSTPTFFFNGRKVAGIPTQAELEKIMSEELKKAK